MPTETDAVEVVAHLIAREVSQNPRFVLGLATGNTMEPLYSKIVEMHCNDGLDFRHCKTFNLDEYVGINSQHTNSYGYYMNHHLFSKINIDLANTHLPDGMASNLQAECASYEKKILDAGGIGLQLLGIGQNGHLGFNEPHSAFNSRTRVTYLSSVTRAQNAPLFKRPDMVPRHAITMGVAAILDCRRCLLLATGEKKAAIVAKAIEGPITSMIPATALQWHPSCTVVCDEAAASQLQELDYCSNVLRQEPFVKISKTGLPSIVTDGLGTQHAIDLICSQL